MSFRPLDVCVLDDLWRAYGTSFRHVESRLDARTTCSLPQFMVLRSIVSSEFTMAPTDIARALGCSKSNVGKIVERLMHVGWIAKTRHPRDSRCVMLRLTPRGEEAYESGFAALTGAGHELLAALDDERKLALLALLQRITGANLR